MFFYITLVPKLQLPGTTEKPQLGGPVRGNNPWLGCLILETPNIWKTSNDSRIEFYILFFLNIPKVRSGYAIWFSGSLIHSYKLGAINSALEKKNLASDTVSLFISINICFKADPPQFDKNASLFSQQSYSSLPCFIHKQSESSPFIYGYVWNAPKVMTSMLGNKNTTLTQFREEEIQLQLTALFSYGLCNTESFICMCQTRCKTNPSHSAHSS